MMSLDELLRLCRGIRAGEIAVDVTLVERLSSDVDEYRTFLTDPPPQRPVPELAELLPVMGWLIYEASWSVLQKVNAAFESFESERQREHQDRVRLVERIAAAARGLPWPEYAPRALGAIRAQALAESKRDTEESFDAAWTLHQDARAKHDEFQEYHREATEMTRELIGLQEIYLQLALAETGTACRTAERVIGRWAEQRGDLDPARQLDEGDRWTLRLYRQVSDGVDVGEVALQVATTLAEEVGLIPVGAIDEHRMAMVTAFQNPGIMTARAALIAYAFTPEIERLGRIPGGDQSWADVRAGLLGRFRTAYAAIERPVEAADGGDPAPMRVDHQRAVVQLRLNLALLVPGVELSSTLDFASCLARHVLDAAAVEELSDWLAEAHSDGNVIATATMPSFIRSVVACRRLAGVASGYHEWRERRYQLDRHSGEHGRRERVMAALKATWPS